MRKSDVFFIWVGMNLVLAGAALTHSHTTKSPVLEAIRQQALLVKELGLTDLCLSTEASYTRFPAVADLHAPFQDHPVCLEHFPSGSFISPPPALQGG
ncbi:MAG: hypothetical protein P4L55_23580 [Syntrophobacteraceae bacterium]|nr:hypothetical protein [Syntrophobacteraceae bacterium]